MDTTQQLDMEKNHPPLQALFTGEINRIYQANSTKQTLQKVETENADLQELQQIAAEIPAEQLQVTDLSADDLPSSFTLDKLTGQKISIAFIPLSDHGRTLAEMDEQERRNFLNNQTYLKTLFIDPAAQNLSTGFGETKGFFYDLLPAELQVDLSTGGCTFTVDQKFENSEQAKQWYAEKYNQAKNNLLKLLAAKPIGDSK